MVLRDLRYGLRLLLKRPAFTCMAVVSIAIGIGANASIFGFADALVLRPLPVSEPDRLVRLHATWPDGTGFHSFSLATLEDLKDGSGEVFSGLAAEYVEFGSLGGGEDAEAVVTVNVSTDFFDLMGIAPAVGRFFLPDEGVAPGGHPVVVLGHGLWQRRFAADPDIVGRDVRINSHSYRVVGVAPASFTGTTSLLRVGAFVPLMMVAQINPGSTVLEDRSALGLEVLGRLADGVEIEAAQTVVSGIHDRLASAYPEIYEGQGIELAPASTLPGEMQGAVTAFMALLMALVGLILTIACANVATMLMARATGRRREMAVRLVNGASRGRLLRQLVTETLLLFAVGGAAGAWLSLVFSRTLAGFQMPLGVPIQLDVAVDVRVVAFTAALTLVAGLLAGLAPALQASRSDLVVALKSGDPRSGGSGSRLRSGLVVAEISLALVLVVVAGLFLQALRRAADIEPGFDTEGVIVANLDLTTQGYESEAARALHQRLLERARELPGVAGAALGDMIPLSLSNQVDLVNVAGFEPPEGQDGFVADTMMTSPGYFATLQMPLVAGRDFASQDRPGSRPVAIVNQTMARRFWGGRDPVGRRFEVGEGLGVEVVGVVADAKYRSLGEDERLYFYRPFQQAYNRDAMALHVRSSLGDEGTVRSLRAVLGELDPDLSFFGVGPMSDFVALSVLPQRIAGLVAGSLGLVGLLLAAVGLYGVTAVAVGQQTRELGVRMALGATPRALLSGVLRRGAVLALVGVAVGSAIALVATRAVEGFLYGANPLDPAVFAVATVIFLITAVVASLAPATRAARTDPIDALRCD